MVRLAAAIITGALAAMATPALGLTMKECGALYQAAQKDGTLGALSWNQFRKARCAGSSLAPAAALVAPETAAKPSEVKPSEVKPSEVKPSEVEPSGSAKAVFPTAIAPAYAAETPRQARFKTCIDQYRANKATGGNAGLKWVEKNGGYYSQCSRRLKGA